MHIKKHPRPIKQSLFGLVLFVIVSVILGAGNLPTAYAQGVATPEPNKYYTVEKIRLSNGTSLEEMIINGPPVPPPGFEIERQAVSLPVPDSVGTGVLTVPAFSWVYGCSAVSGAMIAGYYDQNGWSDMYTGLTNGGVMPMDNSSWPTWSDGSVTYPSNPLVASKNGLDSRTSRGSIDDYWVSYDSDANDPYITNSWAQHTWGDAIGDYMKTSQSAYSNRDGSTSFYTYSSSANQLTCAAMLSGGISTKDGTYGRKLFYEARGYTVTDCYNQKTDNTIAGGFSFTQFKAEIDAGRPVMLNLAGHTIVGVGYDDATSMVYIHDTWDSLNHTMTWGGTYSGMGLLSVSIVNIQGTTTPIYTISGNVGVDGATLSYTDGTSQTATADGSGNYSFMVSSGWSGAVTPTKTGYVFLPTSKNYTDVQENLNGQDYVAKPVFTISGNAGVAGAALSYMEDGILKTVTANSAGAYSIAIPAGWSGTVTPYRLGVSFDPANRTYTDVQANLFDSNYTANFMVMTAADSGSGSLRQVLADAPSGGTVKFDSSLAGQTITLVSTITISKNITLDGAGLNPRVEISGGDAVRIFLVDTPSSTPMAVNIKNLVLKNGRQTGLTYKYYGGAIFVDGYANLTLENALIKNNSAYYAGAIYISSSGKVTVTNSEIINNEADQSGGAVYVNSTGILDIRKSKIAGNISYSGGAIYFSGATNTSFIEQNLFANNSALSGGAIRGQLGNARIEIRGNLFTGNQATNTYGSGGAVNFYASTIPTLIVMENNTFYDNIATSSGGAAYFGMGPTVYLINNTFSNNMATSGGNLYLAAGASVSRMYNNIIANSAGGGDCYGFYNSYTDGSNNLIEDGTAMCLPSITGDPGLLPLADNGGSTQTMALAPDSPAIDTGTNFRCTTDDQRGIARPQGAYCDIGAYEYVDIIAPDTQIDSKPSDPSNSAEATFTFSSADATASFECSLEGGAFAACASPKSYSGLAAGSHTFAVRAKDPAGNLDATPASYAWTIDLTAPTVVSSLRTLSSPTSAASVGFTITFSESVGGVETTDFGLISTGTISDAAVTGISGSGTTYTVTASTGTGAGTLRLDVPATATIADLAGNPLSELPYTSGEVYTIELPIFGKTAPADSATGQPISPTLSWNTSDGAISYEYCYSSAPGPCIKWNSVGTDTSVTINDLASNYTYYWQVRAIDAGGSTEADGGTWWSFTTTAVSACTWPPYTAPATPTFGDVPMDVGHWSWVERLANSTITAGCGTGNYCPFSEVVRAQMAIFLLRGKHCGSSYIPPAVGATTGFNDVPLDATYVPWVKQLATEGITAGCGNGNFCPLQVVNRAQMAIFLLRAKHGSTYSPPAVGATTGFGDVPLDASYAAWVKQLAAEGVTTGCGNGNFCPLQNVNRAQMATFLVRAFGLP